jgi:Ca2+-transporting ATPase
LTPGRVRPLTSPVETPIALHVLVPGRARLRSDAVYRAPALAAWVETALSRQPGVTGVQVNPLTGSILVTFKPRRTDLERILNTLGPILTEGVPAAPHWRNAPAEDWHLLSGDAVARKLGSSARRGLEEGAVELRRQRDGANRIPDLAGRSSFGILAHQFENLPAVLLAGSALLSLATGGTVDALVIVAVIAINGGIGYLMESSSERAIRSLVRIRYARVRVIRSGRVRAVLPSRLVRGDLIVLERGMLVPADARVVRADRLTVDQSALTGESLPVELAARVDPDSRNRVYRGTVVTGGSGHALVTAVGTETEIGRIQAQMARTARPPTALEAQLTHLANLTTGVALAASGGIFVVGLLRGHPLLQALRTSVSMAVAAIPESLPTVAAATLARGLAHLRGHGVIVRRLDAIETLAAIDVVCFDKTGTLTMNEMRVTAVSLVAGRLRMDRRGLRRRGRSIRAARFPTLKRLARTAVLCAEPGSASATETALVEMANSLGVRPGTIRERFELLDTVYRAEDRHYMVTRHRSRRDGAEVTGVKGDPAQVLALCGHYWRAGSLRPLDGRARARILAENDRLAARGLRVLGFASGPDPSELAWLGMTGMADSLRAGIRELTGKLHRAGIETAVLTGDQEETARAVGRALGIATVHARVSPARKLELVRAYQESGRRVAMIGDGINDAPALKAADVGIAMAARGTEAASQSADIALPTDNLTELAPAVKQGRVVHEDIAKAVNYILAQNMSEVLFTFLSVLIGHGEPMTPTQFLWVNLVTDILPELALAQEPPEADVLSRPPAEFRRGIVSRAGLGWLAYEAALLSATPLAAYALALRRGSPERARSLAFLAMTGASLFHTVSARSERLSLFDRERLRENPYVPLAVGAGFAADLASAFVPRLRRLLGTEQITIADMAITTAGSALPFLMIEASKFARRRLAA